MPEPTRLTEEPADGIVVIAHMAQEDEAIKQARENGCDYLLSYVCPPDTVYVMDAGMHSFYPSDDAPWYEPA